MELKKPVFIIFLLAGQAGVFGQMQSPMVDSLIIRGVGFTVACEFDSAETVFRQIVEQDPDSPAGYFYLAANLQYKLLDYETDHWKPEFMQLINRTLEAGKTLKKNHRVGVWTDFYIGSAYGYQGLYQARTGELLAGFLNARKGNKILERIIAEDPALFDAYLGTGNYQYWASKYLKWFFWVPDKRKQGIEATETAVENGKYCRWIGLNSLGYIYYDDGQYQRAAECFKKGLEAFPGTRFYLWGLADSYFKQKAFTKALKVYGQILHSLEGIPQNNGYNEVVCHFKMLKSRIALEEWEAALTHCNAILERDVKPSVAKRLRSRLKAASKLRKRCLEHLGRIQVIRE